MLTRARNRLAFPSIRSSTFSAALVAAALAATTCPTALAGDPPPTQKASEQAAKLNIGDRAPELDIDKWLKGEPVSRFESGRIYVVEFWATWCGSCRAGMPHLSELQRKYRDKGVTIIGVALDDPQKAADFVTANTDRMDYHVALDRRVEDGNGRASFRTDAAYMGQTGVNEIPSAFMIDRQGRLAWFGVASPYFDYVLADLVNGEFDPPRQRAIEVEAARFMRDFDLPSILQSGAWQNAIAEIGRYRSLHPAHADEADWMEFKVLLLGARDHAAAYALANRWIDRSRKPNADDMNHLARMILDDRRVETRDYGVAVRAAKAAVDALGALDPSHADYCLLLAQLARAQSLNGQLDKAISTQQQAVDAALENAPSQVGGLQVILDQYRETKRK